MHSVLQEKSYSSPVIQHKTRSRQNDDHFDFSDPKIRRLRHEYEPTVKRNPMNSRKKEMRQPINLRNVNFSLDKPHVPRIS